MSKKVSKSWLNVEFQTWEYQDQTKIKHQVFSYYLSLWLKLLGKHHKTLNFVDGFGGIGAYHTKDDKDRYTSNKFGSPIISTREILKLQNEGKIKKANILIIDKEKFCIDNIRKIFDFLGINEIDGSINFGIGSFDQEINDFLNLIDREDYRLAPTFFLIDPFGIADIKLETIKRILKRERTEILLNFMYNSLQRWIKHPNEKINKIYDEYFGCNVWRDYGQKNKEKELVKLFRNNCKEFCDFVYPFRFKFPDKNRTYYYLFHLTKHYKGCSLMKDSFAKFNDGKDEYRGKNHQSGLLELIEGKEKQKQFVKRLTGCYKGKNVKYLDILKSFIDETDLLEKEIKKTLSLMEKDGRIKIKAWNNRARRGGFEENDIILFL